MGGPTGWGISIRVAITVKRGLRLNRGGPVNRKAYLGRQEGCLVRKHPE